MNTPRWAALILFISLAASGSAQIKFSALDQNVIVGRLTQVPLENTARKDKLHDLFEEAGCGQKLSEQIVKGSHLPNVICTLSGEDDSIIIVGAHFDKVDAGKGIVDNWSGASMLPSLFQSLKTTKRKHTILFIGFTDEEKGEVGSRYYAKKLSEEEVEKIRAMVNMDTLALGPSEVWVSHADKGLVQAALVVARSMSLPLTAMNVEKVGTTDSESFRDKKIPAITFHSLTTATFPILHSKKDDLLAVRLDDYYNSYRLMAGYIAYLDSILR